MFFPPDYFVNFHIDLIEISIIVIVFVSPLRVVSGLILIPVRIPAHRNHLPAESSAASAITEKIVKLNVIPAIATSVPTLIKIASMFFSFQIVLMLR